MKPVLHFLPMPSYPVLQQLQWEEALLRVSDKNFCIINHKATPAVVLGVASKPVDFLCMETLRQRPIPVIQRFSGGGTVVVGQGTLFVTFIFNKTEAPFKDTPQDMLQWTGKIYSQVFSGAPFSVCENDYVLGNKKCAGNAQYITRHRMLHHTSLLWDFSESQMAYLRYPPKTPKYRRGRSHTDFLCCIKDYLPSPQSFFDSLCAILAEEFLFSFVELDSLAELKSQPHRASTKRVNLV